MIKVTKGMRVIDKTSKCKGTVLLAHNGEFQISWDNGLSGSFKSAAIFQNSGGVFLDGGRVYGTDTEYSPTARTF